jgi:hypothetical protein
MSGEFSTGAMIRPSADAAEENDFKVAPDCAICLHDAGDY